MNKELEIVCNILNEKIATDITVIDFDKHNPICDYFVLATAKNYRHAYSLVEFTEEAVLKAGYDVKNIDAKKDAGWLILDLDDIVVHIFLEEDRNKYQLERLWQDFHITKM